MKLIDRVYRALDGARRRDGVIVAAADGRVLAARDPLPGGYAVLIALDPPRPPIPDGAPRGALAGYEADRPAWRVNPPTAEEQRDRPT